MWLIDYPSIVKCIKTYKEPQQIQLFTFSRSNWGKRVGGSSRLINSLSNEKTPTFIKKR
jgi:hypothetical protein